MELNFWIMIFHLKEFARNAGRKIVKKTEVKEMAVNKYAGTQTEKNLQEAFAGESQARNKYTYFASVAKKEGYEQMSALFLKTADNEKEHAKMWFKELAGIGDTKENLAAAAEGENYEWTDMYEGFAKTAIKKLGTGLENTASSAFDNMSFTSVSDKSQITGTLKIDTATIDGEKYSDYIKADTVTYDIQMDASTEKMAGEIKLQNGSATALTATFYSDGNNMYFKVPELFSESFVISLAQLEDEIDSGFSYGSMGSISKYFSSIDTSNIELYREPVNAAVKCVVKGINTFAEECEYKKGDKLTYNSDNGDIKVSEYSITITKDAVIKACETVIDELYASKDLSSYMTLLTMAGVSQTTIKSSIESSLSDMQPVTISMYVNKKDEIVRLAIDAADYNTSEKGFIAMSFLGNDNPFEYVVIEADVDDINMKYTVRTQDNKAALALEMTQNKEYIKAGAELSASGTTVKIDNLYVNSNIDGSNIDMKLSGEATQKEFSKLKYSASDYSGAYNLANLTETQSTTLAYELMKNLNVLSNVFSDNLYNELFNGKSSSGSARLGF